MGSGRLDSSKTALSGKSARGEPKPGWASWKEYLCCSHLLVFSGRAWDLIAALLGTQLWSQRGRKKRIQCRYFLSFFFFCFLFFIELHHQHLEVPRLEVKLELQLPGYAIATAKSDPRHLCDLYHSSRQRRLPYPLSKAGDWTYLPMDTRWICFWCATMGTPSVYILW